MTMQQYKAKYQSRYKMYTTSNHSIQCSCPHSMAQQGLPILNGSFATRLRFTKMTDRYWVKQMVYWSKGKRVFLLFTFGPPILNYTAREINNICSDEFICFYLTLPSYVQFFFVLILKILPLYLAWLKFTLTH